MILIICFFLLFFSPDIETDTESWDSYDENCLGIEESLFDSHISENLEENLNYMSKEFGFFLPDAEYISDLEGLMTYLGKKNYSLFINFVFILVFSDVCLFCFFIRLSFSGCFTFLAS